MSKPLRRMSKAEQEEWLDQEWGGKSWLHETVRNAHETSPKTKNEISGVAVDYLTRITKLAQANQVVLADLWSPDSPYNVLWTGVKLDLNPVFPRLTGKITTAALNNLKEALNLQTAPESEPDEACVHVASDSRESESSDNEDISPFLSPNINKYTHGSKNIYPKSEALQQPPVAPVAVMMAKYKDKHDFKRSPFLPAPPEPQTLKYPAPSPSAPSPPPAKVTPDIPTEAPPVGHPSTHSVIPSKRKREKELSATTSQRSMKRAETINGDEKAWEATSIYEQLVDNVRLKDSTLDFLTKVIIACHPPEQDKVKVLHPLWFKVDGSTNSCIKLDQYTKLCFGIHHMKPKHWTLAIVDIDDEADFMILNHHDSMPCQDRFNDVCASFMKWKESVGFKHKLGFNNVKVSPFPPIKTAN
ncbi:hypothetical protein IL306_001761 [Fusarium sp. DS 682]|nr:hypothetical protein IL306_001761 [Fusarium sp. DS 682]